MAYSELRSYSYYSFLRGASSPEDLIEKAHDLGLRSLAVTDVGGVYGIPKAYRAARDLNFKLITGAEIHTEGGVLSLLCKSIDGYALMCRMLTRAHVGQSKGKAFLTNAEILKFLEDSRSSALIGIVESSSDDFVRQLSHLMPGALYLPIERRLDGNDQKRTEALLLKSKQLGIPLVATNSVHYAARESRALQDIVTCIREGTSLDKAGFLLTSNSERFIKSPREMELLFHDLPEALQATSEISDQCQFSPGELKYHYPSEWIPSNRTAQDYLEDLIRLESPNRYPRGMPEAVEKQVAYELRLIRELNFADYFLTVYDIVNFAKSKKILCQGRGSAANSIVCYVLGITAIDPVKMNLLFERFISAERGEPPDIDVDFEHERREEVIQYIYNKYGRDRAAMVSAVVTYRSRSAFREVAKAFGVDVGTLSARAVEKKFTDLRPEIRHFADLMEGFPRHLSIHSGGFTLSALPMNEIVPIEPAAMEGRTIVQWDKYDLDILGLLKIDVLSLGMLSAVRKMLDGVGLQFHEIPQDDRPTYEMIHRADTVGTFQIESRAQMSLLPRLKPENFYDLVIEVALMRPGPIVGQMVHPYLRRRRGEEPIDIPHPKLEPILRRTLGVPIFQEQVMKMAVTLADFSPGEADQLRRAIGAWRSSGSIEKLGQRLMDGLLRNGVPKSFADRIFSQIQGFAEYGFPESHAASFALIAYASCYLKRHYPEHFCAALINSQPMGFYSNHTLVDDAKRHGVIVLPVDIHESEWDCVVVTKNTFRLGFRVVHGMSKQDFERIRIERERGKFKSLMSFMSRTRLKKNILRTLALGDVFNTFGGDQRQLLWTLLAAETLVSEASDQLGLFDHVNQESTGAFATVSELEAIDLDYQSFRLSVRGHPMETIRKKLKRIPKRSSRELRNLKHGSFSEIAGLAIVMQRPPTAKGTVFATLEDEHGFIDLILHKTTYEKFRERILSDGLMIVGGKIQRDGHAVSMVVSHVRTLPILREELVDCTRSEGVLMG